MSAKPTVADSIRYSINIPRDPKLAGIAAKAGIPMGNVIGIWSVVLCSAKESKKPGHVSLSASEIANITEYELEMVEDVLSHLHLRHLMDGTRVANWDKYQVRNDSSAHRVAKLRAKRKAEQAANETPKPKPSFRQETKVNHTLTGNVTLHPATSERAVDPHIRAAASFGIRKMQQWGVDTDLKFKGITSDLTPLFRAGIPEEFMEEIMNRMWLKAESINQPIVSMRYFVEPIKRAWQQANETVTIQGTNENGKRPHHQAASRNTGEDEQSRRESILKGLGVPFDMDDRRTGSD